jgi:alkylhydroperoxidase family enzyme
LLGDAEKVAAVLEDYRTAPITDAERALFKFLEKVNRQSNTIGPADIAEVKAAGWAEEALYDAISVCAIFNFYNRWIDSTGVHDMPALGYQMSGHRLATDGYVRPEEKGVGRQEE